jgi:hypothetical protein
MCRIREWVLDANIRYVKCLGGPPGGEGILAGCRDGHIVTIFLDNPFPVPMWKHPTGIRCVDVSSRRTMLALIDDSSVLQVVNLQSGQVRKFMPGELYSGCVVMLTILAIQTSSTHSPGQLIADPF